MYESRCYLLVLLLLPPHLFGQAAARMHVGGMQLMQHGQRRQCACPLRPHCVQPTVPPCPNLALTWSSGQLALMLPPHAQPRARTCPHLPAPTPLCKAAPLAWPRTSNASAPPAPTAPAPPPPAPPARGAAAAAPGASRLVKGVQQRVAVVPRAHQPVRARLHAAHGRTVGPEGVQRAQARLHAR